LVVKLLDEKVRWSYAGKRVPSSLLGIVSRIYPLIRHTNHPLKFNCTRFEILEIRLIDLARG
jgi:hypothetical protein